MIVTNHYVKEPHMSNDFRFSSFTENRASQTYQATFTGPSGQEQTIISLYILLRHGPIRISPEASENRTGAFTQAKRYDSPNESEAADRLGIHPRRSGEKCL